MPNVRTAIGVALDRVITLGVALPVQPSTCFRLFTTAEGLESWLCRKATIEARVGGRFELFWELADPENDSTIGCSITALVPDGLMAFQWRSPRQFKSFANAADPLTHVVVAFHATESGTQVTLVHSGWRSSPEWLEAAAWQRAAWEHAFQALVARAAAVSG